MEIDELVIPPIPYPAPPGFRWKSMIRIGENRDSKTFSISIAKPPKETSKKSHKRLGFNTNVVTDKEFLAE